MAQGEDCEWERICLNSDGSWTNLWRSHDEYEEFRLFKDGSIIPESFYTGG